MGFGKENDKMIYLNMMKFFSFRNQNRLDDRNQPSPLQVPYFFLLLILRNIKNEANFIKILNACNFILKWIFNWPPKLFVFFFLTEIIKCLPKRT